MQLFINGTEHLDPATQLKVKRSKKSLSILIDDTRVIFNVPVFVRMYKFAWPLRTYVFQYSRHILSQRLQRNLDLVEDLCYIAKQFDGE